MSLTDRINSDIKTAMKAKEKKKLEGLRAIKTALLLLKTEKGSSDEMSEDEEIKLLQKLVKQRKESAQIYNEQGRDDLKAQELSEAEIIQEYLPKQMSAEELEKEIRAIVAELGATSMADMGKVMGMANKKLAGKADGKSIANKVKELLS
ncbi:MAG: GatB/YqeY domain-containing protein [Bacteroidota bacterium]|nr:GatB/YqeY domain-containing protein [Bacteroidota bacterium]